MIQADEVRVSQWIPTAADRPRGRAREPPTARRPANDHVHGGSTDDTLQLTLESQRQYRELTVVELSRNFGHQAAVTAGFEIARGQAIILMDADLQDPPEVIPQMSDTDNHLGTSTSFDVIASPPVITAVASIAQRLQMGSVAHVNTRLYHWRQAGLSQ